MLSFRKKTNEPIPRKLLDRKKKRRKDGQTLIHRTLVVTAGGSNKSIHETSICGEAVYKLDLVMGTGRCFSLDKKTLPYFLRIDLKIYLRYPLIWLLPSKASNAHQHNDAGPKKREKKKQLIFYSQEWSVSSTPLPYNHQSIWQWSTMIKTFTKHAVTFV